MSQPLDHAGTYYYGPSNGGDDSAAVKNIIWSSVPPCNRLILRESGNEYVLGDVPIPAGFIFDGNQQEIKPPSGASCCIYTAGGQGGSFGAVIKNCVFTGSVLKHYLTPVSSHGYRHNDVGGDATNNAVSITGSVDVVPGSWAWIKTHSSWHCTRVIDSEKRVATTRLYLLDSLPEGVDDYSSVYLSVPQRGRPHVSGAGLIRVEGSPLGAYYSLGDQNAWGRTQGVVITNCRFYYCLVGIQFDTFVPNGAIETGIVRDIIHREGSALASILDTGCTNGIVFDNITLWPDDDLLQYTQNNEVKTGPNFSLIWKDTRGFPLLSGSNGQKIYHMTGAIGGSHFFTNLSLHSASYGIVCIAGMQDNYSNVMGDGLREALFWFNYRTWGHVITNVTSAWVGRVAKIEGESTAIHFGSVSSVDQAPFSKEAILIGKGSCAFFNGWFGKGAMALKSGEGLLVASNGNGVNCVTRIDNADLPCPPIQSCDYQGNFGYHIRPLFGPNHPAFGCSVFHNGNGFADPTPPRPAPDSDPVAQCYPPPDYQSKMTLGFIGALDAAGLGSWHYNANLPYPCT